MDAPAGVDRCGTVLQGIGQGVLFVPLATHIRTDEPVVSAGLPDFSRAERPRAWSRCTPRSTASDDGRLCRRLRLFVGLGFFCVPLVLLLRQPALKAEAGIDAVVEAHL